MFLLIGLATCASPELEPRQCVLPLEDWRDECATLQECRDELAQRLVEVADWNTTDTGLRGGPISVVDVGVTELRCGVFPVLSWGSLLGGTSYYFDPDGELIGVHVSSDAYRECVEPMVPGLQTFYGTVPACPRLCLVDQTCFPDCSRLQHRHLACGS